MNIFIFTGEYPSKWWIFHVQAFAKRGMSKLTAEALEIHAPGKEVSHHLKKSLSFQLEGMVEGGFSGRLCSNPFCKWFGSGF